MRKKRSKTKRKDGRVREIPKSKPRWRFVSVKMRRMIHCESPLERDYCYYLEFDPRVKRYQEQPLAIEYVFDGKLHHYFIDFQVEYEDRKTRLVEVKYLREIKSEENLRKFAAATDYAEEHGMEFVVVTEQDLHEGSRLENMIHIYRHGAGIRLDKEMILAVIEALSELSATKVEAVLAALTPVAKCHDPRSILYWLIWRSTLILDISHKIEPSTTVNVNHL